MPKPNKGESEKDFVSRCIPYLKKEEPGISTDHAVAKCHGIYRQAHEMLEATYEPPESGDLPAQGKEILAKAYASCRSNNPDYSKEKCSKMAWGAVHNAGYRRDANGHWTKSESSLKQKFFFSTPITIKESVLEKGKGLKIGGVAINEITTRNNVHYPAEELSQAASSLIGKPILKDHNESVDAIVGKVNHAEFDGKAVNFTGEILDEEIKRKIENGLIQNVSIGAIVKNIEKNDEGVHIPKGLEFVELSLVAVPGDPNANITQALTEAFHLSKEEMKMPCEECKNEEEIMREMDEKKEIEAPKIDEEKLKLKEELDKAKQELARIAEERKQAIISKIKLIDKDAKTEGLDEKALAILLEAYEKMKPKEEPKPKSVVATEANTTEKDATFKYERTAKGMNFWIEKPFVRRF